MPVRSIKLKLILPRHEEASHVTRSLWTTHAAVNAAVAYYESRLLLMRAAPYATNDGQPDDRPAPATASRWSTECRSWTAHRRTMVDAAVRPRGPLPRWQSPAAPLLYTGAAAVVGSGKRSAGSCNLPGGGGRENALRHFCCLGEP